MGPKWLTSHKGSSANGVERIPSPCKLERLTPKWHGMWTTALWTAPNSLERGMGERFTAASRPGPRPVGGCGEGPGAMEDTSPSLSPAPQLTRQPEGLEGPGEKAAIRLSPRSPPRGPPWGWQSAKPDLYLPRLRSCDKGLALMGRMRARPKGCACTLPLVQKPFLEFLRTLTISTWRNLTMSTTSQVFFTQ